MMMSLSRGFARVDSLYFPERLFIYQSSVREEVRNRKAWLLFQETQPGEGFRKNDRLLRCHLG